MDHLLAMKKNKHPKDDDPDPAPVMAAPSVKPLFGEAQTELEKQEQESKTRKERSPSPSPAPSAPAPNFVFNNTASQKRWHRQAQEGESYILLVVEREGFPDGAVIADRVDPHLFFKTAPALRNRLEGRRIWLPPASCLDEETIETLVYSLVRAAKDEKTLNFHLPDQMLKNPVSMIKVHCVLVYFEMEQEANSVKDQLWTIFNQVELKLVDILWIWDTFNGRMQYESYTAPFADEYVQMMAWQVVNLDANLTLHEDIRRLIEMENEPKYFTETMVTRKRTYGLDKDLPVPEVPKEQTSVTEETTVEPVEPTFGPAKATVASTNVVGQQTNLSQPPNANQTVATSDNVDPKPAAILGVDHQKKPMEPPPPKQTPFGAPAQNPASQGSNFNFANASAGIGSGGSASQATTLAGTKRSGVFSSNAGSGKRVMIESSAPKPAAPSIGLNLFKTDTTTTTAPNSLGPGFTAPSQPPPGGLQPNLFGQATTQPTVSTANTAGFNWSTMAATQPTPSAAPQPSGGLFGPPSGSQINPFGARPSGQPSQPSGPFGGPTAPGAAQNMGNNFFRTPAPNTSAPVCSNFFGGATPNTPTPAGSNFFRGSVSNTSTPGAFRAFGNTSNNANPFAGPTNNAFPTSRNIQNPNTASFSSTINTNFSGQSQQPQASPFGDPFGSANNGGDGNNMFTFQSQPQSQLLNQPPRQTGGTGGGRKIAKPTGVRRTYGKRQS